MQGFIIMKSLKQLSMFLLLLLLSACGSGNMSKEQVLSNSPVDLNTKPPVSLVWKGNAMINYANELPGVTIITEESKYPEGIEEIQVIWANESPYDVMYGEYYELYKYNNGVWTQVEIVLEGPYADVLYVANAGTDQVKIYMIYDWFGLLGEGDYRIYADYHALIGGERKRFIVYCDLAIGGEDENPDLKESGGSPCIPMKSESKQ